VLASLIKASGSLDADEKVPPHFSCGKYLFSLLQELGAIENFPLTSEKRMG
jgi:hypothetical protein